MDLSKLPRLSESPPPANGNGAVPDESREPTRLSYAETGMDVLISLIVGFIFLMLGASFGGWLISKLNGQVYDTGVQWTSGPQTGQIVELFDLQGGTGWLWMGEWMLGACLILEGLLIGLAALTPRLRSGLVVLALLLCAIGAFANIAAVVMQIRMGFNQPILSMVGILTGAMIAFFHGRHLAHAKT